MLNLHVKYALCGHKASFHKGFVDKLWKHVLITHLPWKYGNVICDRKVFAALSHTSFQYQYSGSTSKPILKVLWVPNVHQAMIQLSDPVNFSGITLCWKKSMILVWVKSCFDLCGCCASSSMAQNDAKSFIWHQSRYSTEVGFMKHVCKWNFLSRLWYRGCLKARGQLA